MTAPGSLNLWYAPTRLQGTASWKTASLTYREVLFVNSGLSLKIW